MEKRDLLRIRRDLLAIIEATKKRFCKALIKHQNDVANSELSRMNVLRTRLYKLNNDIGLDTFNEQSTGS